MWVLRELRAQRHAWMEQGSPRRCSPSLEASQKRPPKSVQLNETAAFPRRVPPPARSAVSFDKGV